MQIMNAAEAAKLVQSGDTVGVCGVLSLTNPETIFRALGKRFQVSGQPSELTIVAPSRPGWDPAKPSGIEHFGEPGMVKRLITSAFTYKMAPRIVEMSLNNQIATYSLPMGVLFRWLREVAAGSPGLITEVGVGTYIDPASGSDVDSRVCAESEPLGMVDRIEIDEKPYLLYRSFPIDVAIIRGTIADSHGNISVEGEVVNSGVRHLAMAAKASGGIVIAQVKHLTEVGKIHPRLVEVPGIMVDAVVVDPGSNQSCLPYEPAFVGEVLVPDPPLPPPPIGPRKVILRRAAMELREGDILNLGYGMPNELAALAQEEGFADQITLTIEHGSIGGLPGPHAVFGASYNPEAILDQTDMFTFYDGGGLDATLLGFAQVDRHGNVCNGRFAGSIRGPGGMINILNRTPTVLFCGTMTAGGLEIKISGQENSTKLHIAQEGRFRKFLQKIEEVDFSGSEAIRKGQQVLFITERAVFRISDTGMELVEIAPGVDIDQHIRAVVDFDFSVGPKLKQMDADLFNTQSREYRLSRRDNRINQRLAILD